MSGSIGASVLCALRLTAGTSWVTRFFRATAVNVFIFGFAENVSDGSEDTRGSKVFSELCVVRLVEGIVWVTDCTRFFRVVDISDLDGFVSTLEECRVLSSSNRWQARYRPRIVSMSSGVSNDILVARRAAIVVIGDARGLLLTITTGVSGACEDNGIWGLSAELQENASSPLCLNRVELWVWYCTCVFQLRCLSKTTVWDNEYDWYTIL